MSNTKSLEDTVGRLNEEFGERVTKAMAELYLAVDNADANLELDLRITQKSRNNDKKNGKMVN